MTLEELTELENASIRAFVQESADMGYLAGRVLDYGSGRMPYKDIVESAGSYYWPYDNKHFPAHMSPGSLADKYGGSSHTGGVLDWIKEQPWDSVLCTQVIQFMVGLTVVEQLKYLREQILRGAGNLVITGPTNWPVVNVGEDLWRFTLSGAEEALRQAAFTIVYGRERARIDMGEFSFPLGWGIVARS